MAITATDDILALVRAAGIVRPRDLEAAGLPAGQLARLVRRGELERIGRGLNTVAGAAPGEHRSLAAAAKRAPQAVVCLLSALRFHELTSQAPHQVWLAIGPKDRAPRSDDAQFKIVRFSGEAREAGVEMQRLEGVEVPIYGPAKSVADCFKFRNKIGVDVAIEALRECLDERRCSVDELDRYARICRVSRVMRPYLEALA